MSRRERGTAGLWWLDAARSLARRPDLWWTGLVAVRSLVVRRWWRSWPPLPRLARSWFAFRMETAYGDTAARPSATDVVIWLEWCKSMRPAERGSASRTS